MKQMTSDTPNSTMIASGYALALPSSAETMVDRDRDGLLGAVKKIHLKTICRVKIPGLFSLEKAVPLRVASYDWRGNKTRVVIYGAGNGDRQIEVYTHDSAGRKLQVDISGKRIKVTTIFHYDKQRVESLEHVRGGTRIVKRSRISVFDEAGNQTEAQYKDDSGVELQAFYRYEFDDAGRMGTILTYDGSGGGSN